MKIEISRLADFLFCWEFHPLAINLDTGELYEIDLNAGELIGINKETGKMYVVKYNLEGESPRLRVLPRFSDVPIYQSYLAMAKEQLEVRFGSWFDEAPVFEFGSDCQVREKEMFMNEAHYMVFDFTDNPTFPNFCDYLKERQIQFAKEWCKKEGYEWYEE